jgi:hypothetical protein
MAVRTTWYNRADRPTTLSITQDGDELAVQTIAPRASVEVQIVLRPVPDQTVLVADSDPAGSLELRTLRLVSRPGR